MSSLGRCSVCKGEASVLYPLLAGSPSFCSAHHNPRDAGPFGADFTGPDDFDIPWCADDVPFRPGLAFLTRKKFVWTDQHGVRHKLSDIDDDYLSNIINFLKRKERVEFSEMILFLEGELQRRKDET